jgi:hypothetical protein
VRGLSLLLAHHHLADTLSMSFRNQACHETTPRLDVADMPPPPQLPSTPLTTAIGPLPPHPATALEGMVTDAEVGKVLDDAASVELTYQQAIDDKGTMGWVDDFIFNTRRTGGQNTEASVLKLYKVSTLCGWPRFVHAHCLLSGMAV